MDLDCTSHRYAYGYYILLVIPMIPWLISAVLTGAALAWSRTFGQKQEVLGIHLGFMCANTEQVKNYGLACLKQSIPFLGVVYNNVCLLAFNTFSCFTLRDGTSVMTAAPLVVCWESEEHRAMVGISIVALIVYVFGFPAITLATTTYARKKDLLRDLTYLKTVGLFYREYGILGRFGSARPALTPGLHSQHESHRRYALVSSNAVFCRARVLLVGLRVSYPTLRALPLRRGVQPKSIRTIGMAVALPRGDSEWPSCCLEGSLVECRVSPCW